jgi:K+-transporting ATPase ATPase B chain
VSANKLLQRNIFIYGLGGAVAPFIAIKIIDILMGAVGLA